MVQYITTQKKYITKKTHGTRDTSFYREVLGLKADVSTSRSVKDTYGRAKEMQQILTVLLCLLIAITLSSRWLDNWEVHEIIFSDWHKLSADRCNFGFLSRRVVVGRASALGARPAGSRRGGQRGPGGIGSNMDRMESFWIAETLKYAYLLQDPTHQLHLDKANRNRNNVV